MDNLEDMKYYEKYMKYKRKYLKLVEQLGGVPNSTSKNFFFDFDLTLIPLHSGGYPISRVSQKGLTVLEQLLPVKNEHVNFLLRILENDNNVYIITRGVIIEVAMTLAYLFAQPPYNYTVYLEKLNAFKYTPPLQYIPETNKINTGLNIDQYKKSLSTYQKNATNLCRLTIMKDKQKYSIKIYGAINGDEVAGSLYNKLCTDLSKMSSNIVSNPECNRDTKGEYAWAVIKYYFIKYAILTNNLQNCEFYDDTQENIDYFNRKKDKFEGRVLNGIGLKELQNKMNLDILTNKEFSGKLKEYILKHNYCDNTIQNLSVVANNRENAIKTFNRNAQSNSCNNRCLKIPSIIPFFKPKEYYIIGQEQPNSTLFKFKPVNNNKKEKPMDVTKMDVTKIDKKSIILDCSTNVQ
jgi:hypothetical protein